MTYSFIPKKSGLVLTFGTLILSTQMVLAEKPKIDFLPIDVKEGFVCAKNKGIQESIDYWVNWDGKTLPAIPINELKRDLSRLITHKADEHVELITSLIAKMEDVFDAYERKHALIDLIKLDLKLKNGDLATSKAYFDEVLNQGTSLPPGSMNFVSNLVLTEVFDGSIETALNLKISAANAGDADALFELTKYKQHPFVQEFWGINPDITVLLAFGSLLGEHDENYCNRARKIAREYANGNYVQRDFKSSAIWYTHLAELGDASSAWKAAELHMFGPKAERDEALVSDYLMKAYESGYAPVVDGVLKYIKSENYAPDQLPMIETILIDAAEDGHLNALNALVRFYKTGQPFGYQSEKLSQLLEKQYLSGNAEAALQLAIEIMQEPEAGDKYVERIVGYLETALKSSNNSTRAIAYNLLRSLPKTAAIKATDPSSIILTEKEAS